MGKATANLAQSTGGFVCVRSGGGRCFVVGFCFDWKSKLHQCGALLGGI